MSAICDKCESELPVSEKLDLVFIGFENDQLKSKLAIAVKALEFYGDVDSWQWPDGDSNKIMDQIEQGDLEYFGTDKIAGNRARAALRELGAGKEEE